ncbi:hypothetical protein Lalb_Chr16g0376311 [Lupinus albus]|uniref:Uncharacterized protein n=1 Tax=Lupinus albus TaxID=3870 RepID=A0A6A4P4I3_LUPAL|nr:hypothetical protein Lalb_Chr16g0376311 [Lupinus albus]
MALQSHMNYISLTMNSLFQSLNLHLFYKSLSIMVCVQYTLFSLSLLILFNIP